MEDLTAQLERDVNTYDRRTSDDGLSLNASSPPTYTGNLDRYKSLVGGHDHSHLESSVDGSSQPPPTHSSSQHGYLTYGQLGSSMSASQPPPSYEDSIMFDSVGVGRSSLGQGGADGGPLGDGGDRGSSMMYGSVTNGRVVGGNGNGQVFGGGPVSAAAVSVTGAGVGSSAEGPSWSRSMTGGGLADGQVRGILNLLRRSVSCVDKCQLLVC